MTPATHTLADELFVNMAPWYLAAAERYRMEMLQSGHAESCGEPVVTEDRVIVRVRTTCGSFGQVFCGETLAHSLDDRCCMKTVTVRAITRPVWTASPDIWMTGDSGHELGAS